MEWMPGRMSITVDDRGRLILKCHGGDQMVVCRGDVDEFVDMISDLKNDIKAMSSAADDTKED
jgi:hypothetical protein